MLDVTSNNALAHKVLGEALFKEGRNVEAEAQFREALRIDPLPACADLADALNRQGRTGEAVAYYRQALRAFPGDAAAHNNLGLILALQGQVAEGIEQIREALRLAPDHPGGLRNLAWIFATCPDRRFRNGAEAVELARRACELSLRQNADFLRTLADAYAEAGRLPRSPANRTQGIGTGYATEPAGFGRCPSGPAQALPDGVPASRHSLGLRQLTACKQIAFSWAWPTIGALLGP